MTQRRPATDDEAKALASSLRLRILRICLGEAHTNKEIAQILGRDPASVLHHTRTLVRTGFLEAQEERRGARGAREIPYLATRRSWRLEVPALDRTMLETFLEELALVPAADVDSTRMGLRLSEGDMDEFRTRLGGLLEEFAGRPSDLTEPAWSFFLVLHPDPNRPDPNRPDPNRPAPKGQDDSGTPHDLGKSGESDDPTGPRGPSNGPVSTR